MEALQKNSLFASDITEKAWENTSRVNEIHEKTSAGRKKALRNNHSDVLTSQVDLAGVLLTFGNSERSE